MTDEADSSVVLAELQVALFRECNNQRLSPWGRPFCMLKIIILNHAYRLCVVQSIINTVIRIVI